MSVLCLDVGNSQILAGLGRDSQVKQTFRKNTRPTGSSDELGIFLRTILRENDIDPTSIAEVAISSVVPEINHSLRGAVTRYFNCEPFFLQAGVKTGLKILTSNPTEVGSDRIATAIGATHIYPNENVIIVDLGTATVLGAISAKKEFLGGTISPGIRISMEVLQSATAKLPTVEILRRTNALGKNTIESIQSGLYFGHLGMIKELVGKLKRECFGQEKVTVIATGGFCHLFAEEKIFDAIEPILALKGIYQSLLMNLAKK
jgi:type III pantothenate kinase